MVIENVQEMRVDHFVEQWDLAFPLLYLHYSVDAFEFIALSQLSSLKGFSQIYLSLIIQPSWQINVRPVCVFVFDLCVIFTYLILFLLVA